MKLNELNLTKSKGIKRAGRGIAAGRGKTAGRGTKGQKSRTGYSQRPGFEGGQTSLIHRLPKLRGFTSHKRPVATITLSKIMRLRESVIDSDTLAAHNLIPNPYIKVKLIGTGEINKKLNVKLPMASKGAISAIEKAGGKFIVVPQKPRPKLKQTTKQTK